MRNNKNIVLIISWIAIILWMGIIFYYSDQVAESSDETSLGVVEIVNEVVEIVAPEMELDIDKSNHIVRKLAHFSVYLILALLVLNALYRSDFRGYRVYKVTLVICILYALSDEMHQFFVNGRSMQISDVLIDSSGSIVGIIIYFISCRRNK